MQHWKNKTVDNLSEVVNGILIIEEWRPVNGYETHYEVSSFGRVRLSKNHFSDKYACQIKFQRIKIRTEKGRNRGGYLCVKLAKNDIKKEVTVHRMVAVAFIPNPENKPEVNHKRGIKTDNRAWELEWVTYKENNKHAHETGLMNPTRGEKHHCCKITKEIVLKIFNDPDTHVKIAKKYGIHPANVGSIKIGDTWSHVTGLKYKRRRFTEDTIKKLRMDATVMTPQELSLKYGRRLKYIHEVLSRKLWKNVD